MNLKIRKVSYPIGAEVSGVDLTKPLTDETFHEIHQAFLEHCLLLFRGRHIAHEHLVAFGRRFGELCKNQPRPIPGYPEIHTVINKPKTDGSPADPNFNGSDWHSDRSYHVNPSTITMLKAVEVPEVGGDTQFANLYLAYDTLSDRMKKLIEGLESVHIEEERELDHSSPERLEASRRAKTIAQPLVKVHPETGRKSLYMGDKVMLFVGMTAEESKSLIDFLRMHTRRQQFIYRHQWQKDDLVVWDQRCLNHNAMGNYDRRNQLRYIEKMTIVGPVTGYLYDDPTHSRNFTQVFTYS